MTFGLSFGTNGTLITDDYSLTQVSVPPSSGAGEFIVNGSLATGTNIPTCFMTAGWGNSQVNSEVREYFKDGLIVRKPNVDPQNLDTNKDGPACGPGD
ncbi:hypothetical protein [Arthrobacter sp. 92]|uniref:hypothetical protein n=1 Tax=Arthrobacter sp. 92 TaxID=3418175 RepID=UPI003D04E4FA